LSELPRLSTSRALIFYGVLLGGALLWGALRGDVNIFVLERLTDDAPRPDLLVRVGLGVGIGLAFVILARVLVGFRWSQRLGEQMRKLLGPLSLTDVTLLAIASSVAEEAFFRGAMQPQLGVVVASIVFGLMHIGPGKAFWPWTLWAVVSGFALGYVTEYTGDILAATLAHFTVNYFNLWQISRGELG